MKKPPLFISFFLLFAIGIWQINAQTSTSSHLEVQPSADEILIYDINATGVAKPLVWGLDTAQANETNVKRSISFMGIDNVDVVRVSYFTHLPLVGPNNDELHPDIKLLLNKRLGYLALLGRPMNLTMNSIRNSVDASYGDPSNGGYDPVAWAANIAATIRYFEDAGHNVISVAPCNECDNGSTYGNGDKPFSLALNTELRKLPELDGVRITSSTLNTDQAEPWYTYLKNTLEEGTTHQLAGSFANYASFFELVRQDGNYASNDELHNVIEAMAGLEYGLQMGIWWGTPEYTGGRFLKATKGSRLAYTENRGNWTAAAVYRNDDGQVEAYLGASERQAVATSYKFVSKDRAVFYDGQGPQREFFMQMPGGTGYHQNQPNAERLINIQWGEDVQPAINGMYKLVNRESGKVIQVAGGSTANGANIVIGSDADQLFQQWEMSMVPADVGGDFTYYKIGLGSATIQKLAVDASRLDNNTNIVSAGDSSSLNRHWFIEYAEDGWFFIGSRVSGKFLDAASITDNANVRQWERETGTDAHSQQWRFLPIGAPVEFDAPTAPTNLIATGNPESIQLNWTVSPEGDVAGYTIFRAESAGGTYSTIGRNVTTTSFVDNTVTIGRQYFYKIKAVDSSLNSSSYTVEVSATTSGNNALVAHYEFEQNILDTSINLNHTASSGAISYDSGEIGSESLVLNGSSFLQVPPDIANQEEITVATWVYWNGGNVWQRIFDFGNNPNEFMYMSPYSGTGYVQFGINNGSGLQTLDATVALTENQWSHVAITLGATAARLYINGILINESNTVTARPIDFKPMFNYIGKSQFSTNPLLSGRIDDFRIYNYELTAQDIANLYNKTLSTETCENNCIEGLSFWPIPADNILNFSSIDNSNELTTANIYDINGRLLKTKNFVNSAHGELNVSKLPSGMYILKLNKGEKTSIKKLLIKH
ncbi:LamG-like jellyroll fold domain-containing protein [Mariniflexile litorale]|uniref:LamG-like jellyroll fold domain-containing protein n=1 Tax=Mariniflexile litorale TaxID=3045158 RepID=A0AAU7EF43_9FLAO|nr:LamG-like jellyroll fold domain-containing protein [Mariniflexile sp. KMM 9835]MDQ8210868.1 RICIN domain-containing protein [Mariniflexile sp. KMM 9835]